MIHLGHSSLSCRRSPVDCRLHRSTDESKHISCHRVIMLSDPTAPPAVGASHLPLLIGRPQRCSTAAKFQTNGLSNSPVAGFDPIARPRDLIWSLNEVASLMLVDDDSFAPAMSIARVAYEDCLLLDTNCTEKNFVSDILLLHRRRLFVFLRSTIHLPMATLGPSWTWIDRVLVINAPADGKALDDLNAHGRCERG